MLIYCENVGFKYQIFKIRSYSSDFFFLLLCGMFISDLLKSCSEGSTTKKVDFIVKKLAKQTLCFQEALVVLMRYRVQTETKIRQRQGTLLHVEN